MTKSKQSMMAAAIAGLIVLGTIGFASALPKQSGSTPAPKGTVTTGTAGRYGAPGTPAPKGPVTTGTAANFGGPHGYHPTACRTTSCKDKAPVPNAPNGSF
jgi:hypothetical protein